MKELIPEILIVTNKYDFAVDYVTTILYEMGIPYLRLNTNDFPHIKIMMDPINLKISGEAIDFRFNILPENLKSIYFRGPTFLRESSFYNIPPNEQLSKSQWTSFIRSLMTFKNCRWVNYPSSIYYAECKPVQLTEAKKLGFNVPRTIISNYAGCLDSLIDNEELIAIKSLDTVFMNYGEKQAFVYTNILDVEELYEAELSIAPVIFQELINPKIDMRVTVIGSKVFPVDILENGQGIKGDWRIRKDNVKYTPSCLPKKVEESCINLVKNLGLSFGAIDLARKNSTYYFIEINPTGEWAWLVDQTGLKIDKAIADYLACGD